MLIAITLLFLIIGILSWILWNHLPIASLHGIPIYPRNWKKTRISREFESGDKQLSSILNLPPQERLPLLLSLYDQLGSAFLIGDKIRIEIVATGQDSALPFIQDCLHDPEIRFHLVPHGVRKSLQSGSAQPYYKVQVFQMLLPFLNHSTNVGSLIGSDSL